MKKNEERRQHRRHEGRFEVKLGGGGIPAREAIATQGLNIGMGGIYCRVPRFIPILTKIRGTVLLPIPSADGGEPIQETLESDMIVVWSDPETEVPGCESYQIGCSFLFLEEEKKRLLQRYIDHLSAATRS